MKNLLKVMIYGLISVNTLPALGLTTQPFLLPTAVQNSFDQDKKYFSILRM